jgi:hypothetical protein
VLLAETPVGAGGGVANTGTAGAGVLVAAALVGLAWVGDGVRSGIDEIAGVAATVTWLVGVTTGAAGTDVAAIGVAAGAQPARISETRQIIAMITN